MRTSGMPASSTVASAMAFGSFGSRRRRFRKPFSEQRKRVRAVGEVTTC